MKPIRRPISALSLALVLAACGEASVTQTPSPRPTPPPNATATASPSESPSPVPTASDDGVPEGWRGVDVGEAGFSLALPDTWQEVSPNVLAESGVIEQLREANPDAAGVLEQARTAIESGQVSLFAFETAEDAAASGFATNLNVINVGPVDGSAQEVADEVAEAIRAQLPLSADVETDTTTLPSGDAAVIRYTWQVEVADGSAVDVAVTQYAIIGASGTGYILSMSSAADAAPANAETFARIAESFRETD